MTGSYSPSKKHDRTENFSKALYGTTGGIYSACIIRPVMYRLLVGRGEENEPDYLPSHDGHEFEG